MSSTANHYADLLAPVYLWMVGGATAAFALGESDLVSELPRKGSAVDLGAGFGMHAVPLARAGWRVLAIDSSPVLLDELVQFAAGLPVTAQCGDLLGFSKYLPPDESVDLVLCMGDTLTHLASTDEVRELSLAVRSCLAQDGRFIATFRDYTQLPAGDARFIPVRADAHRILTCFLEEQDEHVQVHDMLHEYMDGIWKTKVSSYKKLRLAPETVRKTFEDAGFQATLDQGPRGMVRLTAR